MGKRDTSLSIEYVALDEIVPADINPKRHSSDISRSIERFGYAEAVTVDERTGKLVSGHGRIEALQAMQSAGQEPPAGVNATDGKWFVPVQRGWASKDDTEAAAFLVAANRLTEVGGWDDASLAKLLESVDKHAGLEGVGYSQQELKELLASAGRHRYGGDADEVPPVPAEPRTKQGDVWLCGSHRVMCGDATNEADHDKLLQGSVADLVLTDPPYGVGVDYDMFDDTPEATTRLVAAFMPLVLRHKRCLLTPGGRQAWSYPKPTWILGGVHPAGTGAGPWGFNCLNIVLAYGPDPYLGGSLGRRPDTLVMAADRQGVSGHPVAKPLEPWKWLLARGSVHKGDLVFDPFCGAGTTIVAAEILGRVGYGMELSPAYVDVICQRFMDYTGISPVLEGTEETWTNG